MKKITKIILIVITVCALISVFTACSKAEKEQTSASASTTEEFEEQGEESDSQNPIMNFVGEYDNDGCYITVVPVGKNEAKFIVDNPLTDDESECFTFRGEYDEATRSVQYTDGVKTILSMSDDGIVTDETTEYKNGSGKITFLKDGTIEWQDDKEWEWLADNNIFSPVTPQN